MLSKKKTSTHSTDETDITLKVSKQTTISRANGDIEIKKSQCECNLEIPTIMFSIGVLHILKITEKEENKVKFNLPHLKLAAKALFIR